MAMMYFLTSLMNFFLLRIIKMIKKSADRDKYKRCTCVCCSSRALVNLCGRRVVCTHRRAHNAPQSAYSSSAAAAEAGVVACEEREMEKGS